MSLRGQAFRMLKTRWQDAQVLAEELYLILLQDEDAATGPVSADQGDGSEPTTLPPGRAENPFPGLDLGALDLPSFPADNPLGLEQGSEDQPQDQAGGGIFYERTRKETRTYHTRVVVPGEVTGGGPGARYAARLYPDSTQDDGGEDGGPVAVNVEGLLELGGRTDLAAGTRLLVFRHTRWEVKTTQVVRTGPGIDGEKVISTSTEVKVVARHHEAAAGGGGGGGVPVLITGGGPGDTYDALAFPAGPAGASLAVTVTVLQIDPAETLPAGTWLIAAHLGGAYYVQPPVWL